MALFGLSMRLGFAPFPGCARRLAVASAALALPGASPASLLAPPARARSRSRRCAPLLALAGRRPLIVSGGARARRARAWSP